MVRRVGLQKEERAGRERWSIDAGTADVVVRAPAALAGAWHEMTVELDGQRQWSRRLDTHNPGETDTLDYHCRRDVPAGQSLRVRVTTRVHGAVRARLTIEAEEAQA